MPNDKDEIDGRDIGCILGASLLTFGVTLFIYIVEIMFTKEALFDSTSNWVVASVVSFLLSIFCVMSFVYRHNKSCSLKKKWLYLLCLLYLSLVFFCVNASGGLTLSPFISFYATILAVGIIISKESANKFFGVRIWGKINWTSKAPRSLVFLVIAIAFCMFGHLLLQHNNHTGQLVQNMDPPPNKSEVDSSPATNQERAILSAASRDGRQMPFIYLLKYVVVILVALIATGVADYKSLNSTASTVTTSSTPMPQDDEKETT